MTGHTVKAFDADLQELAQMIAEMGGFAERQIIEAVDALLKRNCEHGKRIVLADTVLDLRQREIEQKAIVTIATRQPMAVDLRAIIGVLQIANNIERIGDLAKNIAKRVVALDDAKMPRRSLRGVSHMTVLALSQFRNVLDSFTERDGNKAIEVWTRDEEINSMYTSLFRELLIHMMEDPGTIASELHLLFCAKNIERVGDHAVDIAEAVYYMVEGRSFTERRGAEAPGIMTFALEASR